MRQAEESQEQLFRCVALTIQGRFRIFKGMRSVGFTYWQDGEFWLGQLDEYPDYPTQGTSLEDLKENLIDIYRDLSSGVIPATRRHAELQVA